ncbi:hypothetical protein QTP86_015662 [Hemibagrus guttatus]|nr:hypothetical protein QTP86_015662 [Hemibagrus guttatus]
MWPSGISSGILALSQSTRLHKVGSRCAVGVCEAAAVSLSVQRISERFTQEDHGRHPQRGSHLLLDYKVSEQMFEQVLFSALQEDLSSALSSPEQLELLLLVMRRFSSTLSPAHLDKLLGTASINTHTLSWLSEVVKSAARSMKKECVLPAVASDLLHVSLREDSFTFFWDKVVIDGLMSEPTGPSHHAFSPEQKLEVKLEDLRNVLRSMNADGSLLKSGTLEDTYWSVMKLFGLQKPKVEKVKKVTEEEKTEQEEEPKKKKKGFLPESKKRKNRKKPVILEGKDTTDTPGGGGEEGKKKRKNNKKKRSESETQNQPPVKKTKAQHPQSNVEKKQKKKMKKSGGKSSAE